MQLKVYSIIFNLKFEKIMQGIFFTTVLILFCHRIPCYSVTLSMTTLSGSSISNYYQDLAICPCDLTVNLCDNYCCCDQACFQSSRTAWSNNYQCITTSSGKNMCNQDKQQQNAGSFSELACIYYNNQGNIGYFYQYPTTTNINYPTANLFSLISSQSISAKTNINSLTLTNPYSFTNQYLKTGASQYLFLPFPGVGGRCFPGTINITTSGTYYCSVTLTNQNCANLNNEYFGTFNLCLKGDCSSLSTSNTTISSSLLLSNATCTNMITTASVAFTLASSGNAYVLSNNPSLLVNQTSLNIGKTYSIAVTVSVSMPSSLSGNPGYQIGKNIIFNSTIYSIGDPVTGACYGTPNSSSTISVPFGLNQIFSCISNSSCPSNYYIDTIAQSVLTIQKYGSKSTDTITVGGTGVTVNTCNQRIILNVIYSQDGWELDPQYYITGSSITSFASPENTTTTKYFQINWIYVDPTSVSSPPSNTFYTYFNYLWTPLKEKFGLN